MIVPETEWLQPDEFPDLRDYPEIGIDLETRDPDLKSKGSGAIIGNGEIVGIAVAVEGWSGYFPIAHGSGPNMDKKKVLSWFKDVCESPADKIFHNAMYDVCWIRAQLGFNINGRIIDTMIAASLIDENRFQFTLNSCAWTWLNKGKSEARLIQAAKARGLDPKADMWKMPAMDVGHYAEKDAELTLELWQKFKKQIIEDDLQDIFNLETDLFPCLVDMRFLGVRVDVSRANQLKTELATKEENLIHKIKKETGVEIQLMAARSIAPLFDKLKLTYSQTPTGEPSFTKGFLSNHEHPMVKMIAEARKINKVRTTFIDSIIKYEHNGRIHADINQIRSDDGGTITGRFSYHNPNLQQIPARDPETGPLLRSLFIPEEGCTWGTFDYSQQEPRLVTHYGIKAELPSAYTIGDAYHDNASTDFHNIVAQLAEIDRKEAKTINLGLFYGMGKAKLQNELGVTKDTADDLFLKYHESVPFVKQLSNKLMNIATSKGMIRTLLRRRCRFPKYEPILRGSDWGTYVPAEDHETMLELQKMGPHLKDADGNILKDKEGNPRKNYWHNNPTRRAMTYKALNRLIQGSAADMTKKAMVDLYKEGHIAHIQIHDELDFSVKSKEHGKQIKEIMENAVQLEVPNKVDDEYGPNWGSIE
jgi:DNA polymerase I-like protein with 3'-5' exonuclease and polymerase domains